MAQAPQILLSFDDEGAPVVIVDGIEAEDPKALLELVPGLKDAASANQCAKALNHLAHEQTYAIIEDTAAFADWYKQRLASEDPDADWVEGTFQLSNYAAPDFSAIKPPEIKEGNLTFFVVNRQLGAIYFATANLDDREALTPVYEPLLG
ncbi:hypothetical protein QO034_19515 [Sedimentitalea sp. JM2-8]|uniref:Uncharacterized protein n=1 Tax=Sedimentitalea xiamensis TaxID=3050037 RepID=A0ABT7FJF0_9RHOB|nr:hypothetical protein [Sedimentitalea xiamensis]MDK3075274.1 hypothetical protein [Sedimentitalea xiamensis]